MSVDSASACASAVASTVTRGSATTSNDERPRGRRPEQSPAYSAPAAPASPAGSGGGPRHRRRRCCTPYGIGRRPRRAQVPGEAVRAGARRQARRRADPALLEVAFGRQARRVGAGECCTCAALGIEDSQDDRCLRVARQPVIDHRAGRRIAPGRLLARQRRVAVLVAAQRGSPSAGRNRCTRRRAAMRRRQLAQRRDVVEHPDRAALRGDDRGRRRGRAGR